MNPKLVLLLLCSALAGCGSISAGLDQLGSSGKVQASEELQPFNQGGTVTQKELAKLNYYAKPQSRKAIYSLLGSPSYVSRDREVYTVEGSADQVTTGSTLTVLYDENNQATDWY